MSQGDDGDVSANIVGDVSGQVAVGKGMTQNWISPPPSSSDSNSRPRRSSDSSHLGVSVFISYRRDDAEGHAGRMRDWLVRRFGEERVFQDVVGIDPGEDFLEKIEEKLAGCDVLLAIIGRQWLTAGVDSGRRRVDDPRDWVRLEIQIALQQGVTVIPVLVAGARMPSEADLPQPLAPLARRNAIEIGPQSGGDVQRLGDAIERAARKTGQGA